MERVKHHLNQGAAYARTHWIFVVLLLVLIAWATLSYVQKGVLHSLVNTDMDRLVEFINHFGAYSWVVFVLLTILEVVIAPLSPIVLNIAGGVLFGVFWGGTLSLIGNIIGASIAFLLARKYGKRLVEEHIDPKAQEKFDAFTLKYGAYALFFLRINPLTSTDIFSYLAGLTGMRMRNAVFATALGLAPWIYIKTYFGGEFVARIPWLGAVFLSFGMAALLLFAYTLVYIATKKKKS
ncbi:MAG: TVP38/TMEM64 family protein [Nanoarchaeota archaeon]|nr:TVP38/TMEM64 family protein [Nanoarchaeota archaeon]